MRTCVKIGASLLAAALGLFACEEPKPPPPEVKVAEAPKPPPPPKVMTSEELALRFQQCWQMWNDRKWDDFAGCYAEDATSTTLGVGAVKGKAKIVELARSPAGAFPDGKGELQMVMVNGKEVASVFYFHGTHTGTLKTPGGDVPATSKKVGYLGLHRVRFNDQNAVAEEWWAVDQPTQAFQLGLSKMPARPMMDKAPVATTMVVVAKNDDNEKNNAAAFKKTLEMWNKHDKAAYDVLPDDAVFSDNAEPADAVGKKAVLAMFKTMEGAFSDLHMDVDSVWGAGNYTFAVEHLRGTNDGNMGKMKKTGKKIDSSALEVTEWKDGKMVHNWPFSNGMEMAMQLGMVPEPGKMPAGAEAAHEK